MKTKSNYQDLIKLIALVLMMVDHVGLYIFPEIITMRVLGRYAMPIFCFFAGYNFKGCPKISLLLGGGLLYGFSTWWIHNDFIETNILISIFLGQCYIWLFQRHLQIFNIAYIHVVVLSCLWGLTHVYFDYGTLVIAIMILGYTAYNNLTSLMLAAFIISYLSLFHSIIVFYNFKPVHIGLVVMVSGGIYLSLTITSLSKKISYNVNFLTRHTLIIYCLQLAIIESYWRYYLVG